MIGGALSRGVWGLKCQFVGFGTENCFGEIGEMRKVNFAVSCEYTPSLILQKFWGNTKYCSRQGRRGF